MAEYTPKHAGELRELTLAERQLTDLALLELLATRDVTTRASNYLENAELTGFTDEQIDEAMIRAAKEAAVMDNEMRGL